MYKRSLGHGTDGAKIPMGRSVDKSLSNQLCHGRSFSYKTTRNSFYPETELSFALVIKKTFKS